MINKTSAKGALGDLLQYASSPRSQLNNGASGHRNTFKFKLTKNNQAAASTAADDTSLFDTNQPGWEAQQKFKQLLQSVQGTNLSDAMSLRKNRAELYENEYRNVQANINYQKSQVIQQKLRRGRFRHQRYYRLESERLAAEKEEQEALYREQMNFEQVLGNYPTKFKVANCLT